MAALQRWHLIYTPVIELRGFTSLRLWIRDWISYGTHALNAFYWCWEITRPPFAGFTQAIQPLCRKMMLRDVVNCSVFKTIQICGLSRKWDGVSRIIQFCVRSHKYKVWILLLDRIEASEQCQHLAIFVLAVILEILARSTYVKLIPQYILCESYNFWWKSVTTETGYMYVL